MEGWKIGTAMPAEAVEARRNYQREHQSKINANQREWRADNKDKVTS